MLNRSASACPTIVGRVNDANIVMQSLVANKPRLTDGNGRITVGSPTPNIRAYALSLITLSVMFVADEPINFGTTGDVFDRSDIDSIELATTYVPPYTPHIIKNAGCLRKYTGLVKNVLKPLVRHDSSFSFPLAFDTIDLSTIEITGATVNADKIAADHSTARRIGNGDVSS